MIEITKAPPPIQTMGFLLLERIPIQNETLKPATANRYEHHWTLLII